MITVTLFLLLSASVQTNSATPVQEQPMWKEFQRQLHASGDIAIRWSEMAARIPGRMTPAFIRPMWARIHDPNMITVGNGPDTNKLGQWDGSSNGVQKGFWKSGLNLDPISDFQDFLRRNRFVEGVLFGPTQPGGPDTVTVTQDSNQLPSKGQIQRHWSTGPDNTVDETWKFGANGMLQEYVYILNGIGGPQAMSFKVTAVDTSKKPDGWWK